MISASYLQSEADKREYSQVTVTDKLTASLDQMVY